MAESITVTIGGERRDFERLDGSGGYVAYRCKIGALEVTIDYEDDCVGAGYTAWIDHPLLTDSVSLDLQSSPTAQDAIDQLAKLLAEISALLSMPWRT